MRKLHVGFMKDLRNHAFHQLYDLIIELVEDEQIKDLDIQANLEGAKLHQGKFSKAFAKRERNPYTVANEKLIEQRTQCLIMLRNRLKSYLPSFIPQEQAAAKRIHFVMREYGKKYYVPSNKTQADMIDNINAHISEKENFKEAFATLGLNALMDQINELTQRIDQNYKQYITTSTQIKNQRKGVRKEAYTDLKIMIEGIMYKFQTLRRDQAKRDELEVLMEKIYINLKMFSTPLKSLRTQRANQRTAHREKEATLEKLQTEPQKMLPEESIAFSEPTDAAFTNSDSKKDIENVLQLEFEPQIATASVVETLASVGRFPNRPVL